MRGRFSRFARRVHPPGARRRRREDGFETGFRQQRVGGNPPRFEREEYHAPRAAQKVPPECQIARTENVDREWKTRGRVRTHGNGDSDGERDSARGVSDVERRGREAGPAHCAGVRGEEE